MPELGAAPAIGGDKPTSLLPLPRTSHGCVLFSTIPIKVPWVAVDRSDPWFNNYFPSHQLVVIQPEVLSKAVNTEVFPSCQGSHCQITRCHKPGYAGLVPINVAKVLKLADALTSVIRKRLYTQVSLRKLKSAFTTRTSL